MHLDYSKKFQQSINKLKSEGRYRFFNEIERKYGSHPIASWITLRVEFAM